MLKLNHLISSSLGQDLDHRDQKTKTGPARF